MLLGAFRGGNPIERIVGVPSLWPRPGGVLQQHGLGDLRQIDSEQANFRVVRYSGANQKAPHIKPLTFLPPPRLRIDLVHRTSITSALLILMVLTSASACVAGCGSQPAPSCSRTNARQACARRQAHTATTKNPACGDTVKSQPGRCGVRSFIPFQFATLPAFETSPPLKHTDGNVSAPLNAVIGVSSIGSPETDRGPPRS